MDQFRTPIRIQTGSPITHQSRLFTAGSCFSDLLGARLKESRFRVSINPFGVSYNPASIHKALGMALGKQKPAPELYAQSEGSFRHMDFHSSFRAKTLNQLAAALQQRITEAAADLEQSDTLLLTYGTSWAYRHRDSGQLVNNCQKLPAREFDKQLIDPADIISSFATLYKTLSVNSPSVRVILTVSPVRHLRDTMELNQVSKSGLIIACHKIAQQFRNVEYFPAYEIMMDDLRDYRFYDRDMIHPSPVAVDYIWEKFDERYFSGETRQVTQWCLELSKAVAHRPFDTSSSDYRNFLLKTLDLAKKVSIHADVTEVINDIEGRLNFFAQLR